MGIKQKNINLYFTEYYPSLGSIKSIEPIRHNNIHSINFLISTAKGKYVLRNFMGGSCPAKIEKICFILDSCLKQGAKVLRPIKNKANKYVDYKRKVYLTRYYEGGLYNGSIVGLKNVAKNIALLHSALAQNLIEYKYSLNRSYYQLLTPTGLKRIEAIIIAKKNKNDFDKKVLVNINYLKERFAENKQSSVHLKKFRQKQLIHFDLTPANIIVRNNKVVAIIDFNAMRKGDKIEDLAFASFRFSVIKASHPEKIKRRLKVFIDCYSSYSDVSKEQLNLLDCYYTKIVLGRLSYILKKRYYVGCKMWCSDFDKNINFLRLAQKIGKFC